MQRSAVIGDGDGAAGEGGIAADLDGGNIIGVAGGGEGGTGYGEVAIDIDGSGGEFSGTDGNMSAAGDGEVCGISSVIGYPDGTDGKGAGAGDGEALLRGYDGGRVLVPSRTRVLSAEDLNSRVPAVAPLRVITPFSSQEMVPLPAGLVSPYFMALLL